MMGNKSIWKKIQEKFQKDQEELQEEEVKESTKVVQLLRYLERKEEITLLKGMTDEEIQEAEQLFGVKFPIEMKEVYKEVVPVGSGYCNWSDFSIENVNLVHKYMKSVKQDFLKYYDDIYWPDEYVERGLDKDKETFEKMLMTAPDLMPIFGSRCVVSGFDNGPVISVVGTDIIYYGENLLIGFEKEYSISFGNVHYYEIKKKIPFWSEMIEI